jgi:hypothetical protein
VNEKVVGQLSDTVGKYTVFAVAMICTKDAWPKDGNWKVKWEKLRSL